ncbi:hypothetical protein BDEG_25054 [Batrachochytrium dendrobatidis JEL423]|uniref:Uncharacterized protein n=1 Tax=Batrachochytrium dendrobatidis (strain JEL423) TaxID=403673 RepID=A0A177WMZ2_BATDL|nr:hypothetical protein BDEG_25054 [Batrachochytrium dendrobatidis JEL423]
MAEQVHFDSEKPSSGVCTLSKKTQKLVQAASVISETLKSLESSILAQTAKLTPSRDVGPNTRLPAAYTLVHTTSTSKDSVVSKPVDLAPVFIQSHETLSSVSPMPSVSNHPVFETVTSIKADTPTTVAPAESIKNNVLNQSHTEPQNVVSDKSEASKLLKPPVHHTATHRGENIISIFSSNGNEKLALESSEPIQKVTQETTEHISEPKSNLLEESVCSAAKMIELLNENRELRNLIDASQKTNESGTHHSSQSTMDTQTQPLPINQPVSLASQTKHVSEMVPWQDMQFPPRHKEVKDLQFRIAQLESQLITVKSQRQDAIHQSTILSSKCDSMHAHNHELQMRVSRQALEMKSLSEQNEMLRKESQRAIERENALNDQISKLAKNLDAAQKNCESSPTRRVQSEVLPITVPLTSTFTPAPDTTSPSVPVSIQPTVVSQQSTSSSVSAKISMMQLIDERIKWTSTTTVAYRSADVAGQTGGIELLRQLDTISTSFHTFQQMVESISTIPNVHVVYLLIAQVVETVWTMAKSICFVFDESLMIDGRIERIRGESSQVRLITERTIHDMTTRFKTESVSMQHEMDTLKHQLQNALKERDALQMSVVDLNSSMKSLVASNTELRQEKHALMKDQAEMETDIRVREAVMSTIPSSFPVQVPVLVNVNDTKASTENTSHHNDSVQIHELKCNLQTHIEYLEKTITEWQSENSTLQQLFQKSEAMVHSKNAENCELSKRIVDFEDAIENEKLRTKKLVELVKVLKKEKKDIQTSLSMSRSFQNGKNGCNRCSADEQPTQDPVHLGRVLENHITSMTKEHSKLNVSSIHEQPDMNSLLVKAFTDGNGSHGFEAETLFKLVRDNETTSQQLTSLGQAIEDVILKSQTLDNENKTLKERIRSKKLKAQSRESCWLDKIKSLKGDLAKSIDDCGQLDRVLADYEKQFNSILIFTRNLNVDYAMDDPNAGHPYPFASLFAHVSSLNTAATTHASLLQQKLVELQQHIDAKEAQLQAQISVSDAVSHKSQEQTGEIHDLQKQNEFKEREVQKLRLDMQQCEEARKQIEAKLKKVVSAYKSFMSDPCSSK